MKWLALALAFVMLTGATDGARLRRAGIPTYGVSGLFGDMDDTRSHGKDERITIENFHQGQDFLFRLVKAFSGGPIT